MDFLVRIVVDFVSEILRGLVEWALYFDAPAHIPAKQRVARLARTAPWHATALICLILYGLLLIGLIVWVSTAQHLPRPGIQCVIFGLVSYQLIVATLFYLLCLLRHRKWKFTDFHTAVAQQLGMGPRGFAIALLLLHGLQLLLWLIC